MSRFWYTASAVPWYQCVGDALLRRQQFDELAEAAVEEAPAALQVPDQALRLVLRERRRCGGCPELTQLESAKSMMRNLPPNGTAGLARQSVSCQPRAAAAGQDHGEGRTREPRACRALGFAGVRALGEAGRTGCSGSLRAPGNRRAAGAEVARRHDYNGRVKKAGASSDRNCAARPRAARTSRTHGSARTAPVQAGRIARCCRRRAGRPSR